MHYGTITGFRSISFPFKSRMGLLDGENGTLKKCILAKSCLLQFVPDTPSI